jgi:hypothetical protein
VGEAQGRAEELGGEPGNSAARAKEHLLGGIGEEVALGTRGAQSVIDEGGEDFAVERIEVDVRCDPHGEGGVLLHAQGTAQRGEADEPEGQEVAAVEGEIEEAGEVEEEPVGQMMGLVDLCGAPHNSMSPSRCRSGGCRSPSG